jgi:hypothetical protein
MNESKVSDIFFGITENPFEDPRYLQRRIVGIFRGGSSVSSEEDPRYPQRRILGIFRGGSSVSGG